MRTEQFKKKLSAWLKQQQVMSREQVLAEISALASRSLSDCTIQIVTKNGNVVSRVDRALVIAKLRSLEMLVKIYGMMDDEKPAGPVEVVYRHVPFSATKGWLGTGDDEESDLEAGGSRDTRSSTGNETILDQLGTDRGPAYRERIKGQP
jgi:hypothetical protein